MDNLINLLSRALFMSTPLILGALGEVISERAGMMNCAVEGVFLAGAFGGFAGAYVSGGNLFIGFIFAILSGLMISIIYAYATIYMYRHQIVMGTAVAILTSGLCMFFYRVIFGTPTSPLKVEPLAVISIPILNKIPILGPIIFSQNIISYITYILVPVVFFILYKTSLGLTIRSCGENPESVDVAGLNIRLYRFGALLFAGALGGLAGSYYSLCNVGMYNSEIINGRGWIAFGICFLGNWNPIGALIFGIIFGISDAIGTYVKAVGFFNMPSELFSALPYILVILLTALRRNFNVPEKLGVNYVKEN